MGKEDKGLRMRLLFIGDSLIEYFDWQHRFPGHDAINLGISGETVGGLYARLKNVFNKIPPPDLVFVMTGINNLAMDDRDFPKTYGKVITEFKARYPSARVIIHSLLPVRYPFISNDEIRKINVELKTLADEKGVVFLDVHSLFVDERGGARASLLLEDGVHLSPEGYRTWSSEVEKFISS